MVLYQKISNEYVVKIIYPLLLIVLLFMGKKNEKKRHENDITPRFRETP